VDSIIKIPESEEGGFHITVKVINGVKESVWKRNKGKTTNSSVSVQEGCHEMMMIFFAQ